MRIMISILNPLLHVGEITITSNTYNNSCWKTTKQSIHFLLPSEYAQHKLRVDYSKFEKTKFGALSPWPPHTDKTNEFKIKACKQTKSLN